jgi:predicted metal-dependent peptidase
MSNIPVVLQKAKVTLALDYPFFNYYVCKRDLKPRKDIWLFAVDKGGNIYYNPDNIEKMKLTVGEVVWGLCHEVGHLIGLHALREGGRDHFRWNYAGDAYINDMLNDCGVGKTIANTVNIPGSKDKTVEEIYRDLPEDMSPPQGGGGTPGDGEGGPPGMGDDLLDENAPQDEGAARVAEAEARMEAASAAMVAKQRGKMPGSLQRMVDAIVNVKTPWYDIMERFMTERIKTECTWRKPNRRFIGGGVYLPSIESDGTLGEIVIEIDVSGSIGQKELDCFCGHVNKIIETTRPTKVHVVYVDSAVAHVDTFEPDAYPIKMESHGGGGTDMREVFNWINDEGIEPACVVVLTDGYTPFPTQEDFPTIWAISTDVTAPADAGATVHFEIDD